MGCSAQDQITGYKAINKKLKELNPKVDAVKLQYAINDYWLGLSTVMNDAEKDVYRKLVEQTDGLARIGLGGNKQLNEGLVMVKEVDGEYSVHLESGKNYTFAKGKVNSKDTAKGQSVTMESMILTAKNQQVYGFGLPGEKYAEAMTVANSYTKHMMLTGYDNASKFSTPYILKWHKEAMKKSDMYARTYNTIRHGTGDLEITKQIKATLFMTGDTSEAKMNKLTTLVHNIEKYNTTMLTTEMPELDRKIKNAIRNIKERELLNVVYGTSGYAALYQINGLVERLNKGDSLKIIVKDLKFTEEEKTRAKELKKYLVDSEVDGSRQNAGGHARTEALAVLEAFADNNEAGYKLYKKMVKSYPKLHKQLDEVSVTAYAVHGVVNKGRKALANGKDNEWSYKNYDGHGLIDVFSNTHEFKILTESEMDEKVYNGKGPWKRLREPENGIGIVFRKSQNAAMKGQGVTEDRINNGLYIDPEAVKKAVKKDKNWLKKNNVIKVEKNNSIGYKVILRKDEKRAAEGLDNIAQSLYRSWMHNSQLIELQTSRDMIIDEFTENIDTETKLKGLEARIRLNKGKKVDDRKEVKPFLSRRLTVDEKKKYKLVAEMYIPAKGISTYNGFNEKVQMVRSDMQHIMVGYSKGSILPDGWPIGQWLEKLYKELVQLRKIHMVATSPTKLSKDITSNIGFLSALDVPMDEGAKDITEAIKYTDELTGWETELVGLNSELTIADAKNEKLKVIELKKKVANLEAKLEKHPFHDALKYGFIQSMATSLMIKEFDTISGLQHTINDVVSTVIKDSKGNPNGVHEAVVKWMQFGDKYKFGVDHLFKAAANLANKKNTKVGDELKEIGDRIEAIKKDKDVVAYLNEIIAGPESEMVRQGGRIMQVADIAAKWSLYKYTLRMALSQKLGRKVTRIEVEQVIRNRTRLGLPHKELERIRAESGNYSMRTFIDYRLNLPEGLQVLSDYAVTMFPSYWLRNTKVALGLLKDKPASAAIMIGLGEALGSPNIYDSTAMSKTWDGTIAQAGLDVFTPKTVSPLADLF